MSKPSSFSEEELKRAQAIAAAVRGDVKVSDLVRGETKKRSMGTSVVVGLTGCVVFGLLIYGGLQGWQRYSGASVTPPLSESLPRASPSKAEGIEPTRGSQSITSAVPLGPAPRVDPVPTRTMPKPVVVPKTPVVRQSSSPATRSTTPTTPTTDPLRLHSQAGEVHAARYFENEYRLGSSNLVIHRAVATNVSTVEIPGWGRWRSDGDVTLEYTDRKSGGWKQTRRGYEIVTTTTNGRVEVVDFTVKAQPFRPLSN